MFRRRSLLSLLACILGPLALYLVLPLLSALNPPYAYLRVDSVRAFLDLVLARTYQGGLFRGGWAALPGRMAEFGHLLVRQFGPLGLGLGLVGGLSFLWRDRRAAWALWGGMAVQVAFALNYYVPNTFVYYLPVYVWLAVCVGVAVDAVFRRLAWPHLALMWLLAVAVLPSALCVSRWPGSPDRPGS